MSPRVTSFDVARVCGVSRATVSYVLNNTTGRQIPAETRQRVLKAADALGYRPFGPARILRDGNQQLVLGVLPFDQLDSALARDLSYLQQKLAARQFTVVWHVGPHLARDRPHPSAFLSPSIVIAFADQTNLFRPIFLRQFGVPVLFLDIRRRRSVGQLQVNYLVQRGKREIIFVAPQRRGVSEHLNGVRQECARLGLTPPSAQIMPCSRQSARQTVTKILRSRRASSLGICCYNDEVALTLLAAFSDSGIEVPEEVAVIGCDDVSLAQFSIPPLTTIAFDNRAYLDFFIGNILAATKGESLREIPSFSVSIIARQSA
jgi:DNA-binding LacI/PurR family transcriptional regulator